MIKLIKRLFKPKVDFVKLIKQGALVVDVRTKSEYVSGHIDGSKNIPLDKISTEIKTLKQQNRSDRLDCYKIVPAGAGRVCPGRTFLASLRRGAGSAPCGNRS